jgi:uncharacterized membrane protein YeaQ/YmgE (transglycosylase-associated protein family)
MGIVIWLALGLFSTVLAVFLFRKDGKSGPGELYYAAIAPFLGPVVLVMIMVDLIKRYADSQ